MKERYHGIYTIERREKYFVYEFRRVAAFIEACHRTEHNHQTPPSKVTSPSDRTGQAEQALDKST